MSSYQNIFGGASVQTSNPPYNSFNLNIANVNVYWASQVMDNVQVIAYTTRINCTHANATITLPDATLVGLGNTFRFFNTGNRNFDVLDNDSETMQAIAVGEVWEFCLIDNTTPAGQWSVLPYGSGYQAVTSVAATQPTRGVTINGSPITSVGDLVFALANMLAALETLGENNGKGFITQDGDSNLALRKITPGNGNIAIQNQDGSGGDIVITLSTTLTALISAIIGNLHLQGNAITTEDNNPIQVGNNVDFVNGKAAVFYGPSGTTSTGLKGADGAQNLVFTLPVNVGGNNAIMQCSDTGVWSFAALTTVPANKVTMETPVSTINPIIPANMLYHPGVLKAAVIFDGTHAGTPEDPIQILYNYNINAVTKAGVGAYTITVVSNFVDANFLTFGSACNPGTSPTAANMPTIQSYPSSAGSVAVFVVSNDAFTDYPYVAVYFFGNLQ